MMKINGTQIVLCNEWMVRYAQELVAHLQNM